METKELQEILQKFALACYGKNDLSPIEVNVLGDYIKYSQLEHDEEMQEVAKLSHNNAINECADNCQTILHFNPKDGSSQSHIISKQSILKLLKP